MSDDAAQQRPTEVGIRDESFTINGRLTYEGRYAGGNRIEGLLMNSRMVQATFDDLNPKTRPQWAYPDTGEWDAERHTDECVAAMPVWRRQGLLAVTVNLQGGSPEGYSKEQPWHNSAFRSDGSLRPGYMARLARVLAAADELGMVVIVGLFYFGQDQRLSDEAAVIAGVDNAVQWLLDTGHRNLLIEVNNECNHTKYAHDMLGPERVDVLIRRIQESSAGRLPASASFTGGKLPSENVVAAGDFVLLHGNGVSDPKRIGRMVRNVRTMASYRPQPILFNEDDHFEFDQPVNNMMEAVHQYASWGYFDPGENNYRDGYQSPPVQWLPNTERKKAFFTRLAELTGAAAGSAAEAAAADGSGSANDPS